MALTIESDLFSDIRLPQLGDFAENRLANTLRERPSIPKGTGQTAVLEFIKHPVRDSLASGLALAGVGFVVARHTFHH